MRILLVVALLLEGCKPTVGPGGLPVYEPGSFCSLAGLLPTTLHIEPNTDAPTWVVEADGRRTNLEWPKAFSLEVIDAVPSVVDPDGNVVATDGEELTDAGGGGSARGENWFAICGIGGRFYTTDDPTLRDP